MRRPPGSNEYASAAVAAAAATECRTLPVPESGHTYTNNIQPYLLVDVRIVGNNYYKYKHEFI